MKLKKSHDHASPVLNDILETYEMRVDAENKKLLNSTFEYDL